MIKIIFEAHSTTFWNEQHKATGVTEVALSELGIKQSHELGDRYRSNLPTAVYCSERSRSIDSAKIAFEKDGVQIIVDARLNECNLGGLEGIDHKKFRNLQRKFIDKPWPGVGGESYTQTTDRMGQFLADISKKYAGENVKLMGCTR